MQINSKTENPTRNANARAMPLDLAALVASEPPRIIKKSAAARLQSMATKANVTRIDMQRIIR